MHSLWLSSDLLQGLCVFERSKIEMIILIAIFRIGNGGRKAVHFDAMMHEFNEVKDRVALNGKLGSLGALHPNHVWGCFSSLLTAGVLKSRLSRYSRPSCCEQKYLSELVALGINPSMCACPM